MDNNKCIWGITDEECSNDIKIIDLDFFAGYVKASICSIHLEHHEEVMKLYKQGYDIEDALKMVQNKQIPEENTNVE